MAKFSPDGKYVACAVGRLLQVRGTLNVTGQACRGGGSSAEPLLARCLLCSTAAHAPLCMPPIHQPVRVANQQVWKAPGLDKSVSPMELHRTYGQCHTDITTVDWSADSCWLAVGGKDLSARVFSMQPIEGYRPPTLSGHREPLVAGGCSRVWRSMHACMHVLTACIPAAWRLWLRVRRQSPRAPAAASAAAADAASACFIASASCSALHDA